jgi:dTDP-4-amino-4,6-dideoxy-D-galactose acyltransferase
MPHETPRVGAVLTWDSEFFGKRIGRIQGEHLTTAKMSEIQAWITAEQLDGVYFLAAADDALTVRLAEDHGFRLQDVRMTFARDFRETLPAVALEGELTLRLAQSADVEALRATARSAYQHTRFYNDPHFSAAQCAALYDVWLTRSITDPTYADSTFVAVWQAQAVGYVACHLRPATHTGTIGLVGITEQARGQAIGQKLVLTALHWFQQQGMTQVEVTTQGRNIGAQRLYQRCGFLTQSVALWYHWWKEE